MLKKMYMVVLGLVLMLPLAAANDWNQWRGPNRNGSTAESDWSHQWGKEGPKKVWEARIGAGYSNLCISGRTGFTLGFDGMSESACVFNVYALDLETGKVRWKTRLPPGSGSRKFGSTSFSSPVTDGKWVYALGGHGEFAALKADSGEVVWSKDLLAEGALPPMRDMFAASPLLLKDRVVLNTGLCLDRQTGAVLWKTEPGVSDHYASPVPVVIDGEECVLIAGNKDSKTAALHCLNARTGKALWSYPFTKYPLGYPGGVGDPFMIAPDRVLYSCNNGYALMRFSSKGAEVEKEFRWSKSSVCDPVQHGDFMFGFSLYMGDPPTAKNTEESYMQCMDLKTGEVKWKQNNMIGTVLLAGDRLVMLTITGHLAVLELSAAQYKELASAQLDTSDVKAPRDGYWTAPILCDGRLYVRRICGDKGVITCFDVSNGQAAGNKK